MPTANKDVAPLEGLKGVGRTLQDAGLTLLHVASNAVGAVAKGTLTATSAVIAAAEETSMRLRRSCGRSPSGSDAMKLVRLASVRSSARQIVVERPWPLA